MRSSDAGRIGQRQDIFQIPDRLSGPEDGEERKAQQARRKEETEKVKLDISEAVQEMLQKQADANREAAEDSADDAADLGKIMETARRIARGDQVPQKDEKKLMEYNAELYQMAKSAAMLNRLKKHKKHKSLYDEEEDSMQEKIRKLSGEENSTHEGGITAETASGSDSGADGEL